MSTYGVCAAPSDDLTRTNKIYVNPSDPAARSGLVMVNGFPFAIEGNDKVAPGFCAFNSIQRKCLEISTANGSMVTLRAINPKQAELSQITIRVEHLLPNRTGGSLDCLEFSAFVKDHFGGQCFAKGQQLALLLDFAGLKLRGTVQDLQVDPSSAAPNGEPGIGCVSVITSVLVTVSEASSIGLTNVSDKQMDQQQAQLVQNFNLENLGIGGLRSEFGQVFRRAFVSRMFPLSYIKKLGIKHVKGVLLYGPPGTGKTLIARKIGEILNCHEPKIVNGPEVFNKYVGGTEENIRKLFAEAEAEQAAKGDQSKLHLIIFDEFDAICKQRGAVRDSTGVNDNVVNQLLSKIDGVNSLNNVLLIGMTNRLDLIDEAILRPGRFEVHVEIGLPDEPGRVEIFRIHTRGMRENHYMDPDVSLEELASLTKNYSGAEIEGVVRSANSNALNRHIDIDNPGQIKDPESLRVCREDFLKAVEEVTPAFGQAKEECANLKRGGIIDYGNSWAVISDRCARYVHQLTSEGKRIQALSVLVEGPPGCGKSAVAAYLADQAQFPYVKVISNEDMVGYPELQKVNIIRKAFEDAYKSNQSCIILDDLERLIEFSQLGGRYSNALLQALLVLIKRPPPEGKKILVISTTSQFDIMDSLELAACFSVKLHVTPVPSDAIPTVASQLNMTFATTQDLQSCVDMFPRPLPIKELILVMEMASEKMQGGKAIITYQSMSQALESAGIL